MNKTIAERFDSRSNNFDLIRLLAAALVIVGHSYTLTASHSADPVARLIGYRDGGNLAVCFFFVISGFLVMRSFERNSLIAYISARFLRIIPALVVVVFLQVFVLGSVFTTLPLSDYFSVHNIRDGLRSILIFDIRFRLSGVFDSNPYPSVVNGSLWTLPIETLFYLLLPWIALTGILSRSGAWIVALGLVGLRIYVHAAGYTANNSPLVFNGVPLYHAVDFSLVFFAGVLLWIYRNSIPLSGGLAFMALVLLYAAHGTNSAIWVFYLTMPYLVLYLALSFHVPLNMKKVGDMSYGVYIYGFPVQQALIAYFKNALSPVVLSLVALPIVLVLAFLSWQLVESPALRLKNRMSPKPT